MDMKCPDPECRLGLEKDINDKVNKTKESVKQDMKSRTVNTISILGLIMVVIFSLLTWWSNSISTAQSKAEAKTGKVEQRVTNLEIAVKGIEENTKNTQKEVGELKQEMKELKKSQTENTKEIINAIKEQRPTAASGGVK